MHPQESLGGGGAAGFAAAGTSQLLQATQPARQAWPCSCSTASKACRPLPNVQATQLQVLEYQPGALMCTYPPRAGLWQEREVTDGYVPAPCPGN